MMRTLVKVLGLLLICSLLISLKLFFSLDLEDLFSHSIDDWNISNVVYDAEKEYKKRRGSHVARMPGAETSDFPNFQQALAESTLPDSTDITPDDLFENHSFETGNKADTSCTDPLCPTTSLALTTDPLLDCMQIDCPCGEEEAGQAFVAVKLESTVHSNYRKKLNLVLLIDISRYMAVPYNHMKKVAENTPSKMDFLIEGLASVFSHLLPDEQLGIVLYNENVIVAKTLRNAGSTNMRAIVRHLHEVQLKGEPNFEEGLEAACSLIASNYAPEDQWDNRVVVFFGSRPELSDADLKDRLAGYIGVGIQFTFLGLGVGFSSTKVEMISTSSQLGHFKAATTDELRQLMSAEGFDSMITPIASNLRLHVKPKTDGISVEALYHNSGLASQISTLSMKTEQILTASTLVAAQIQQNLMLFRVKHMHRSEKHKQANKTACVITADGRTVVWTDDRSPVEEEVELHLTYQDQSGAKIDRTWSMQIEYGHPPRFDNPGVRKAVLLQRYSTLMRSWLLDAWELNVKDYTGSGPHRNRLRLGHELPAYVKKLSKDVDPARYQRSYPVGKLHKDYSILMNSFLGYFCDEARELKDSSLLDDGLVLARLIEGYTNLTNRDCLKSFIEKE
mmetsp:Transcript_120809/g.225865  ORF Transcript_120809/g.225865 Transcript_120809/m.225865 type:complete len:620 (+) Transcript_120809:162-2021(+)